MTIDFTMLRRLSTQCGGKCNNEGFHLFSDAELIAFAAAIERVTIEAIIRSRSSVIGNDLNIRPENGTIQVVTLSQDYVIGD